MMETLPSLGIRHDLLKVDADLFYSGAPSGEQKSKIINMFT